MNIIPEKWIKEPDENGNGLLQGLSTDTSVEFPFVIETHNVYKEEVTLNKEQSFSFIFEALPKLAIFKNEEAYEINKNNHMATQSLIPCGLFPADPEMIKEFTINPTAIVTGVVNEVVDDPCAFGFDESDVLYSIDCLGWDINCVIHKENNKVEGLKVGSVIQGTFIVQGWPEE